MSDNFLSQEEIDNLLRQAQGLPAVEEALSGEEKDALGEIGNISMGSAATALSQILNQRVSITTPRVWSTTPRQLFSSFQIPYCIVTIQYTQGMEGSNLLIIRVDDAAIIANLMLGGDGQNVQKTLGELEKSAVAEAMNQMIGSAATAMSTMFNRAVGISPPQVSTFTTPEDLESAFVYPLPPEEAVVVVSFQLVIGDLVDSEMMQVIPVAVAKREIEALLPAGGKSSGEPTPEATVTEAPPPPPEPERKETSGARAPEPEALPGPASPPAAESQREEAAGRVLPLPRNLDLILDVPLEVSVVLGHSQKPIKEVLSLVPGAVVELDRLVDEPVDILVNGTLVARGEVVVVNENFGVRLTRILSPSERLNQLRVT